MQVWVRTHGVERWGLRGSSQGPKTRPSEVVSLRGSGVFSKDGARREARFGCPVGTCTCVRSFLYCMYYCSTSWCRETDFYRIQASDLTLLSNVEALNL